VLKRNLSPALGITADVVINATFPEAEIDREKKRQLDLLAQTEKNGGAIASRVRAILAFGPDHPYGRPAQGFPRTVQGISRDDVVAFHKDRWKPGSSAIVFVGAVTLAEATALAQQHFGAWSGGAAAPVTIPAAKPAPTGRIYLVDRQDAAQTNVQQFLPAPRRDSDDYYALRLADAVWGGGGFGTRLNMNLREDKGYSYGVFSTLQLLQEAGSWYAAGGVQTDKTKESVAEFDKELKALGGAKEITADEFTTAKQVKTRGYAQQFEAFTRVGGEIANLWSQGLPMTELQREYDETAKATLEATLAAAKKYARPERASIVLVGDRRTVEAGMRELALGDVVVLDSEGKPTAAAGGTGSGSAR